MFTEKDFTPKQKIQVYSVANKTREIIENSGLKRFEKEERKNQLQLFLDKYEIGYQIFYNN